MGWALGALAVLLVLGLGWYLSFTASRLDRLHHRVEGARATLDAQLVRRAEAAIELVTSGLLDPASALLLAAAAADALTAGEDEGHGAGPQAGSGAGVGDAAGSDPGASAAERESAESDLSQALDAALGAETVGQASRSEHGADLLDRVQSAGHRVQLARRFHNQAVADAQRVRRKRVVRWAHLAGRARLPQTFEMDDDPPAALSPR